VTNAHLQELLTTQGADTTILPDVPVKYPQSDAAFADGRFTVAVICSFDYDEPVDLILNVACALPDVRFLVTGDPRRVKGPPLIFPSNLSLTGFLDNAAYGQLLRTADVVMALTTGQHKMLRAAYEAIYQGTPIVISDLPMLREEFPRGALLVQNSVDDITAAIRQMRGNLERFRRDAHELRTFKERRWETNRDLLLRKIGKQHRTCHDAQADTRAQGLGEQQL
jgi:glycosyltransferase involved in cell wall biosynthesis